MHGVTRTQNSFKMNVFRVKISKIFPARPNHGGPRGAELKPLFAGSYYTLTVDRADKARKNEPFPFPQPTVGCKPSDNACSAIAATLARRVVPTQRDAGGVPEITARSRRAVLLKCSEGIDEEAEVGANREAEH